MAMALAAAREAGLEVGILRAERALHRPADLRAARGRRPSSQGSRRSWVMRAA